MGKLYLITGDIIDNSIEMSAIVNAQNKYMINGSGICGAIYRNSGKELLDYCKKTYNKEMNPCEVRVTPGFNLGMEIIHVYAPIYKEWDNPIEKLIEAYKNVLSVIKDNNYKKVIIPSLGTGIHGYKHEEVANKVIQELLLFCDNNDVNIYFINLYPLYTDIYLKELLIIKKINIKNDLLKSSNILNYLNDIGLFCSNSKFLFDNFVNDKKVDELCLLEKIIVMQYSIEYLNIGDNELKEIIQIM